MSEGAVLTTLGGGEELEASTDRSPDMYVCRLSTCCLSVSETRTGTHVSSLCASSNLVPDTREGAHMDDFGAISVQAGFGRWKLRALESHQTKAIGGAQYPVRMRFALGKRGKDKTEPHH